MEQVRARVVAHRVGAAAGVDDRVDGLADPQPAVERAAVDDQPADRPLGVLDGEEDEPPPASRSSPWSPTWPPPSA